MTNTNAITTQVMIDESKNGIKLFRNHRGKAWQGNAKYLHKEKKVIINNPRFYEFGLYPGAGDLIGWSEIIITPDMVGKKIAIFTSEEIKSISDTIKPKQQEWHNIVKRSGGISKIIKENINGGYSCL